MDTTFARLLLATMATLAALAAGPTTAAQPGGDDALEAMAARPAVVSPGALKSSMLGVARAGRRIVAVGDRGAVLLSDDGGSTFRQAKTVPTRATLTSVCFDQDGKTGWAAGHWGVILTTSDAGETWRVQRHDLTVDRPLFTIFFTSPTEGYAAGLWSLFLRTRDAGRTWESVRLAEPEQGQFSKTPRNLLGSFASTRGTLFITAEQGAVYRSVDQGRSWALVQTGGAGSFWTGIGLRSGSLLAAGLGGSVYRSTDDGLTWSTVASGTRSSITGLTELPGGKIVAVGMDGLTLTSTDDGQTFSAAYDPERTTLTAVIGEPEGRAVTFTAQGPRKQP